MTTILIVAMMSGIAIAEIETDWEFGKRNPIPDETYIRFDFETGGTTLNSYAGIVNFVTIPSEYPIYPDRWYTAEIGERGYHIHPMDFYYNYSTDPKSQVDYIYVVNGNQGAQPIYWWCNNVKCEWWPGCKGRIEFPKGADDVSFLSSNGAPLQMKAYDKRGKYLGYSGVSYSNIERVPPNPSNFNRVNFTTERPIIYAVEIMASGNNFFIIDDLVIGGLTLPEPRRDYGYAADRMKTLVGAPFNEFGTGFSMIGRYFHTADEIINDDLLCYDPTTGEVLFAPGIYDQYAIVWAFNEHDGVIEHIVEHYDITELEALDFTEEIAYEDVQAGDVFFIDYPVSFPDGTYGPDGQYDEVGIYVGPMIDTTGDTVDIIRIIPEQGMHYSTSEFINTLYGDSGFVDYRSLPDNPKGSKCPYPKPKGKPI